MLGFSSATKYLQASPEKSIKIDREILAHADATGPNLVCLG